jgi:hypothetical protein
MVLLRQTSVEESNGHLLLHINPQQRILELLESKKNVYVEGHLCTCLPIVF